MRILIEAMHGLGDVVCMTPLIREIREAYRKAHITVIVKFKGAVDIIKQSGLKIDEIKVIDAHEDKIKFLKFCFELRKKKYDISISGANTPVNKAKWMMLVINAKYKTGIQFLLRKNYTMLNDQYHFVDANLLTLKQLGLVNHHYHPELIPDTDETNEFKKQVKCDIPIIGVCIGRANISYRNSFKRADPVYTRGWGSFYEHVENMETIIKSLLKHNYQVALIGGKSEMDIQKAISEETLHQCLDYIGRTTIAGSMALAGICDVVIGVDTGMQHIADAIGARTVSIFGPTNPKTHGAYSKNALFAERDVPCRFCYGTNKYVNCENRICMKSITPEQVLELVDESLKRKNSRCVI